MSDGPKIDLTRYQTKEIATKVGEIVSVPENIRTVVKTTFWAVVLLTVLNGLICTVGNKALLIWMFSSLYSFVIAIVLGFALGLIRVIRILINRSETLIRLLLQVSQEVAKDYRSVNRGEKNMPSAVEIVEHVYQDVLLPAVEAAVASSFGIIRVPLLWTYRRTIGGCVRFLITRMKTASLTEDEKKQMEIALAEDAKQVAENVTCIEFVLEKAMVYTQSAANALRIGILYPVQLTFAIVVAAALIPLGLILYWGS